MWFKIKNTWTKNKNMKSQNLPGFISLYKFRVKFKFHRFVQKSHEFRLWLIWMIFVSIQYLKYSNGWDIAFDWHPWMFMCNTQKSHNFIQNYTMIIAWIQLKCKSYVFHIKTSQVEKKYLYRSNMYILDAIFTFWNPHMLHGQCYGAKSCLRLVLNKLK
jgi:hypothetical protein